MRKVEVDGRLCKGCGICIEICPYRIFNRSERLNSRGVYIAMSVNPDKCVLCGICELFCPDFAIAVAPKEDSTSNEKKSER